MLERDKEKFFSQQCDVKDRNPKSFIQWIDFIQKNKPQTNALALMLMIYGGSQIGWGIFNNHIEIQPWSTGYEDAGTKFYVITSFFISSAVGLLFGSLIVSRHSKLAIYVGTSLLSIASSVLLIYQPTEVYIITLSRVIGGFSHGIAYLTVLIHGSEVAVPRLRGMIVGSIHLCVMVGVFVTSSSMMPVYKIRSFEIDPTRTLGFNGLICMLTGLLLALIFNRESPVYLIKKYKEDEALEMMIRLRSESHETVSIRHDFNEFRLMVQEDSDFSINILNYWLQILRILLLKFIFVATFNMRINNYFLELGKTHFYDALEDYSGMYLSGARLGVMIVAMFFMDFKRIHLLLTSSIGSGVILLYLAYNPINDDSLTSAFVALAFQLLAGLAVGIFADIYTVDAVNTRVKPYFIALTSIIETLLQIFLIIDFFYLKIAISSILTVLGLLLIFAIICRPFNPYISIIPDTSQLSLRLARDAFLYGP